MSEEKTYVAKVRCGNCNYIKEYKITKGMTICKFLDTKKPVCRICGCAQISSA